MNKQMDSAASLKDDMALLHQMAQEQTELDNSMRAIVMIEGSADKAKDTLDELLKASEDAAAQADVATMAAAEKLASMGIEAMEQDEPKPSPVKLKADGGEESAINNLKESLNAAWEAEERLKELLGKAGLLEGLDHLLGGDSQ